MGGLGALHAPKVQGLKGVRQQFSSPGAKQLADRRSAPQQQSRSQQRLISADAEVQTRLPASHSAASKAALAQLRSASMDGTNREWLWISFFEKSTYCSIRCPRLREVLGRDAWKWRHVDAGRRSFDGTAASYCFSACSPSVIRHSLSDALQTAAAS